jgi:hypothetical protein
MPRQGGAARDRSWVGSCIAKNLHGFASLKKQRFEGLPRCVILGSHVIAYAFGFRSNSEIDMLERGQSVEMAWTWGSILTLSITTGIATAILNQGLSWLKEAIQRRESDRRVGRMLALSLVEVLTSYAQECNARVRSNRWDASIGEYGTSELPTLRPYDESDRAWAVIAPPTLAGALRDFKNQKDNATRTVNENDVVNGPEDAISSATHHCVDLGYKAWKLAQRLRKNYTLGLYSGNSDFAEELESEYHKNNPNFLVTFWRRNYRVYRVRVFCRRQLRRFFF